MSAIYVHWHPDTGRKDMVIPNVNYTSTGIDGVFVCRTESGDEYYINLRETAFIIKGKDEPKPITS